MTARLTTWDVETSHMCAHPGSYTTSSLSILRRDIQAFANSKKVRVDRPAIGPLDFTYELDDNDEVCVIRASFRSFKDRRKKIRFMRLRRRDS